MTEFEHDFPVQDAEEPVAPEPEPQDGDDADDDHAENAYREFLADRRTLRYEDNASNRRELFDYLLNFSPPLPETPAALYLAFDELRKDDKLDMMPLAPEKTPDDLTEAEVKADKQGEPDPEQISKDARATLELFRKRQNSPMQRYKNGALVS